MTKEKKYIAAAFLIGIIYRLLMSLQGIDSIDMGFCMTFYQNIFNHPEAMTFYFNYYLTGLIGGVWNLLFGQFGLLGFRVLETITVSVAIWLLYLSFRPWFHSTRVAAVAILVSFLFPSFVLTFHYDTLSFLLMSSSVYALSRWQQIERPIWLWTAGVMIGIAFFARIVNGSLAALILVPFVCGCLQSWKRGFTLALTFGSGMLAGSIAVLVLMLALGHWPYFMAALSEAFGTFNGNESSALRDALPEVQNSHTSANLFSVYLKSYVNIGLQVLALAGIALFYGDSGHLPQKLKLPIRILLLAVLFVLVLTSQPYLSAIAICSLLLLISRAIQPLVSYVLICAYLFPFGSDIGIPGIFHWCAGLLILPTACCYRKLFSTWQKNVVCALCVAISLLMLYKMGSAAQGEEHSRLHTTTIALPGTLNVMTDSERAERYRNEVSRIQQYGKNNPWLLIGNQASELYYATGKLPFTGNTQMGTFMGSELIERLDRQAADYRRLPLIVYIKRGHDTDDMPDFRRDLEPWMQKHHYTPVYEDDDLTIFTTQTSLTPNK
jgi:hypothetical protein